MLKGFREFILRGNVIELAVAVVIGAAFTAVVNSIVANLINPLIAALFRADSLDNALVISIPTLDGQTADVKIGAVLGSILTFAIVAAVVYFVFVLPMNHLKDRAAAKREAGTPDEDEPENELMLLSEIRDLLAERSGAGPRAAASTPSRRRARRRRSPVRRPLPGDAIVVGIRLGALPRALRGGVLLRLRGLHRLLRRGVGSGCGRQARATGLAAGALDALPGLIGHQPAAASVGRASGLPRRVATRVATASGLPNSSKLCTRR